MSKPLSHSEVIRRFRDAHGDKYDYSRVVYNGVKKKVEIICPEHGSFWQVPMNHLKGIGCRKCGRIVTANKLRLSRDEFLKRMSCLHGNKYDFSLSEYVSMTVPVRVICDIHGEFFITPNSLMAGCGCNDCGNIRGAESIRMLGGDVIERFRCVHGDRYDYSIVEYVLSTEKVNIICKKHGVFSQAPSEHYSGKGCPKCAREVNIFGVKSFFKRCGGRNGIFYVIRCRGEGEDFYKIGITSNSVKYRYRKAKSMPYHYDLVYEYIGHPVDVFNMEINSKRHHKPLRYKPNIKFGGYTECFSDIDMSFITHYD